MKVENSDTGILTLDCFPYAGRRERATAHIEIP
jgi:hypothetical protein